jgi:hypothetical protein
MGAIVGHGYGSGTGMDTFTLADRLAECIASRERPNGRMTTWTRSAVEIPKGEGIWIGRQLVGNNSLHISILVTHGWSSRIRVSGNCTAILHGKYDHASSLSWSGFVVRLAAENLVVIRELLRCFRMMAFSSL